MIIVEKTYDLSLRATIYRVIVPDVDLIDIELDSIDRAVVMTPANNAADVLQNLQILAFRQLQQSVTKETNS